MRVALVLLAGLAAAALVSAVWTPHPVDGIAIGQRLAPASLAHPLGTDHYGRDLLSMLMAGARTSLGIGAAAVVLGALVGVPLGLFGASAGRWARRAVDGTNDLLFAFPALIVAVILATVFGPGAWTVTVAVALFTVPVYARLTAAAARTVLAQPFVDVARLAGKGRARIAAEHVLPNVAGVVLTQAASLFAVAILAEAGLSYVGLGAQPPVVSWGRMLAEGQTLLALAPQLALWPGLAVALAVFCVTTVAEGVRRRADPRAAG